MGKSEAEEYQKWQDTRSRLISALEDFKKAVDKAERDLEKELNEACDEAGLKIEVYES